MSRSGRAAERRRVDADRFGRWAEMRCVWRLRLTGYRVLARRFRSPVGEIDIVARRGGTVAFVEVKARASHDSAAFALTDSQLRRIARAAEALPHAIPRCSTAPGASMPCWSHRAAGPGT